MSLQRQKEISRAKKRVKLADDYVRRALLIYADVETTTDKLLNFAWSNDVGALREHCKNRLALMEKLRSFLQG